MKTTSRNTNLNFIIGSLLTIAIAMLLIIQSFRIGKIPLFFILNGDMGKTADIFFEYWTNLGDGVMWIPVALMVYFFRKKKMILILSIFLLSTFFTQLLKNYIFPAEPRPVTAITDHTQIHMVDGVEMHTVYSFPSGHTATAFCIFLMSCLLISKTWILPVGVTYALLVGYSRIYLAQHFPLDVGGGMLIAVFSVYLAQRIQLKWENKIPAKNAAD